MNIFTAVRENMNIMREQIGNFNWETPAIKKNRVESLVLKNIITKIKNSLDGLTDHLRYYKRKVFNTKTGQ